MEEEYQLTNLVILELLFKRCNGIKLLQKSLSEFDSVRCLFREVIEEIWSSELLEKCCPTIHHMRFVEFRSVIVPGLELLRTRT